MTEIFKGCMEIGYVPKSWRQANVIFIPKPGKKDMTNPRSFRPITLTNVVVKGLEKILVWFCERDTTVGDLKNQFGFSKGKSTETAISKVVDNINLVHIGKSIV